jgi:hypothetical protein
MTELILFLAGALPAFAQAAAGPAEGATPASSNVRGSAYPAVDPELRVTFRLKAPDAERVEVRCRGSLWGGKPVALAKGTAPGPSRPRPPSRGSSTTSSSWMASP